MKRERGVKPYLQRKCGDKIRFSTYADAFGSARHFYRNEKEKLVPYQCPICNGYHIGHPRHENDLSTAFVSLYSVKNPKETDSRPGKAKSLGQIEHERLQALAAERRAERLRKHEMLMAARSVKENTFAFVLLWTMAGTCTSCRKRRCRSKRQEEEWSQRNIAKDAIRISRYLSSMANPVRLVRSAGTRTQET